MWHVIDMQLHKHYDSQCICHTMGWIIYKWIVGKVWAGLPTLVGWALRASPNCILQVTLGLQFTFSCNSPLFTWSGPIYELLRGKVQKLNWASFAMYFQSLANITFSFLPMDWKYQHKAKKGLKILQFRIKILHLWISNVTLRTT